jgi:hypothetical protein
MTNTAKWFPANISQSEKVINFWDGIKDLPGEYENHYVQCAAYSLGSPENPIDSIGFWIIGIANTDEKKEALVYLVVDGRYFKYKGQARTMAEAYNIGCFVMERTKLDDLQAQDYHAISETKQKKIASQLLAEWSQKNVGGIPSGDGNRFEHWNSMMMPGMPSGNGNRFEHWNSMMMPGMPSGNGNRFEH